MYYSYLYDQKLRNILSTFHCYQEKLQVIVQVAGLSLSVNVKFLKELSLTL